MTRSRDLKPARISYGTGKVTFPHNRRQPVPGGGWTFGVNPDGPVDQTVPVLRITGPGGQLRGVLFGLSCHPSVLTYEFFVVSGDYAGNCANRLGRRPTPAPLVCFCNSAAPIRTPTRAASWNWPGSTAANSQAK